MRVWKTIYPDDGGTGAGTVTFAYTPAGKLYTRTTQDGVVTTYTYNDLHQLTGRSYSVGSQPSESFAFDRSGRLLAADKSGVAEVDLLFDKLGWLTQETLTYLPSNDAYTTEYDYTVSSSGATRTITYPSGRVVRETYDKRIRQGEIDGDAAGSQAVGTTWGYDDANRRSGYVRANGVAATIGMDVANRITEILCDDGQTVPTTLVDLSYGYDPHGNRLWTENGVKADRSEIYTYDNRHRLTGFRRGTMSWSGSPAVPSIPTALAHNAITGTQSWSLDRRGNWLTFTEQIGSPLVTTTQNRAVANGANEYGQFTINSVPGGTPTHDAKGNLTNDPYAPNYDPGGTGVPAGQYYQYDAENRLVSVTTDDVVPLPLLEIVYDALGRRIESADHTGASVACSGGSPPVITRHLYSGIQPIEEHVYCSVAPAGWDLAREFVWGPQFPEPIAMIDHSDAGDESAGTPEVLHYSHDTLGSAVLLTDLAAAPVESYTYDPYGRTVIENGAFTAVRTESFYGNPFGWTGQRYDAGVLLYHFLFRGYGPTLGRWLQRDPLGHVDGVNLLEYLGSRAPNDRDPFGLCDEFDEVDIQILRIMNDKDQFLVVVAAGAAITLELGKAGILIAGVFVPFDDPIVAAVLSKYGVRAVWQGGEWVFVKTLPWWKKLFWAEEVVESSVAAEIRQKIEEALEHHFAQIIKIVKGLPDGSVLSKEQIEALTYNINQLILVITERPDQKEKIITLLKNDPRFRFLDQLPELVRALEDALGTSIK